MTNQLLTNTGTKYLKCTNGGAFIPNENVTPLITGVTSLLNNALTTLGYPTIVLVTSTEQTSSFSTSESVGGLTFWLSDATIGVVVPKQTIESFPLFKSTLNTLLNRQNLTLHVAII